MLSMYGNEIVVMDATYKTSIFDIPLFFIPALSNTGYIVVASFMLGKETTNGIAEALLQLKEWNPAWTPRYFLTDYDVREIRAIEDSFEGRVS